METVISVEAVVTVIAYSENRRVCGTLGVGWRPLYLCLDTSVQPFAHLHLYWSQMTFADLLVRNEMIYVQPENSVCLGRE